jgi:putative hydrolase of the HAD superfamily
MIPSTGVEAVAAVLDGAMALLLDVDDTIVDTRAAMVHAGAAAMLALWPERLDAHRDMAVRYYDDPDGWFPRYASGEVGFEQMRAGRLAEVARAYGAALGSEAGPVFEAAYAPAFRSAQRLFPDVPRLLAAADELGLPVALLTNSAAAPTRLKLEALALADRFEVVVTTDTLGFGKPDPRVYREACRRLGVDADGTVCLGDNLDWDVLGARSAGLRALWLDRAGTGAAGVGEPGLVGEAAHVVAVRGLDDVTDALLSSARPSASEGRFGPSGPDR